MLPGRKMSTPNSHHLLPMTPTFGQMQGSVMMYDPATSHSVQSENPFAIYPGSQPQMLYSNGGTASRSNSMSMLIPNSFHAYPQNYNYTQQYGGGSTFPSQPTTVFRSANYGPMQPTNVLSVSRPEPISAPYRACMDQNVEYVSQETFAQLFGGLNFQNMPVTRVAHTQTKPIPTSHWHIDPNNFKPVAVAPKYSTQISARVKYMGPAFKGGLVPTTAARPGQKSITVSVQSPKPNQLPFAAHSSATVTSETAQGEFSVSGKSLMPTLLPPPSCCRRAYLNR